MDAKYNATCSKEMRRKELRRDLSTSLIDMLSGRADTDDGDGDINKERCCVLTYNMLKRMSFLSNIRHSTTRFRNKL